MVDIPADITSTTYLTGLLNYGAFSGSGRLETVGDHDWFKIELTAGVTYRFFASFLEDGSLTEGDATLGLYDADGNAVALSNDGGVGKNSFLSLQVAQTGSYFIDVGANGDDATGNYSLYVSDFQDTGTELLTEGADTHVANQNTSLVVGGAGNDLITLQTADEAIGEQGNDTIFGNDNDNRLSGGLGDDIINGDEGSDVIFGGHGNDKLYGGPLGDNSSNFLYGEDGDDDLFGADGNDAFIGGPGADHQSGGAGDDRFYLSGRDGVGDTFDGGADYDRIVISPEDKVRLSDFDGEASSIEEVSAAGVGIYGTSSKNVFDFSGVTLTSVAFIDGQGGKDNITGSESADDLRGAKGKDKLNGGEDNDLITGGRDKDILIGGDGEDTFIYSHWKDSKAGGSKRDKIKDFDRSDDLIDLSGIDAKSGGGNQKFNWIGKSEFHEKKGELRYDDKGSKVIVEGDIDGDGMADFELYVKASKLSAGDFEF